jgi:large subunit ribosomal protein L25
VTAGEIKLPRGVTLAIDPETVMVVVAHAPTAEQLEGETAAEEPAEGEESEAGEAAEGEKSEG